MRSTLLNFLQSLNTSCLRQADLAKAFINKRSNVGNRIGPMFGNSMVYTHNTRVTAVGADWIEFERPLSVDMDLMFGPQIYRCVRWQGAQLGVPACC